MYIYVFICSFMYLLIGEKEAHTAPAKSGKGPNKVKSIY